jgi:hypothetical protein
VTKIDYGRTLLNSRMRSELAKVPQDIEIGKCPLKIGLFPGFEEKARQKKAMMRDMTNS